MASIPACHAGDRGSIPRDGAFFRFVQQYSSCALLGSFFGANAQQLLQWSHFTGRMQQSSTQLRQHNDDGMQLNRAT